MELVPAENPASPSVEKGNPTRRLGPSAPWWLWFLTLGGFALIFWQFLPEASQPVPYSPWFLDQVEAGNIQKLSIQGLEVRGVLRPPANGPGSASTASSRSRLFITYFPSDQSIDLVVRQLRESSQGKEPVLIETSPPQEGGLLRLVLLIQAASLLMIAVALATIRTKRP
jgi:cell division protease FtsH